MKLLLTDCSTLKNNNDLSLDIFKSFGETVEYDNISRDALLNEVKDTDIILCNKTVIDREVIANAEKLKYIGIFATGYNNIDIPAARDRGIPVCNAGGYSTNAVVQQVMGYILMHYTKIPEYNSFVKEGSWVKSPVFSPLVFTGDEVYGKTLGIIGYGSIGKAVKKAAEGLGMKVIVNTRTVREDGETVFVDRDTLFAISDIISVHCPLNDESRDMMNRDAFAKFKDGAFFINTSRGGVVDEYALADALNSGKLSGAAVDVLKQEPMSTDCPLLQAKNIIITPHTSWAPLATRQRLVNIVADNVRAYLNGNTQNDVTH
ncbi:MAG: D-2-hydroxyacid dehydrogenase [Clostridia bacterium]|nr:D-2-hydroxyacid dehydrogenase [Clostridia bacterium]